MQLQKKSTEKLGKKDFHSGAALEVPDDQQDIRRESVQVLRTVRNRSKEIREAQSLESCCAECKR